MAGTGSKMSDTRPPEAHGFTVERWIESLHEDHNGLVWITKAELRQALAAHPVPDSGPLIDRLRAIEEAAQEVVAGAAPERDPTGADRGWSYLVLGHDLARLRAALATRLRDSNA